MSEERLLKVLLAPHESEKATLLSDKQSQFVFKVLPDANKQEIKAAVEKLFKVSVVGVNMLNVKGKTKRFGQRLGRRNNWKKAYVRIADGQDIDFLSA